MKNQLTPGALALILIFFVGTVYPSSYYVSPSGGGEACTLESPCSLTTGLSKPRPGDEVVLLDGVYSDPMIIKRGGALHAAVTVRAANKWRAVVRVPNGILGRVWASYVTVSGIVFDGAKTGGKQGAVRVGAGDEIKLPEPVHDVILEYLHIRDVRAAAISITSGEHDIIVRHCQIERTGHEEFWGEGFYLGNKYDPSKTVYNLDIYFNNVQGFTQNGLETKKHSRHVKVHHNYFQGQVLWKVYGGDPKAGNEGTITIDGHSHEVYNNKLWNNECGMAVFVVEPEAGHKIYNNLVYNGRGRGDYAVRMKNWSKTWARGQFPPSQVFNNTFYGLPSHAVGSLDTSILTVKNNIGLDLEGNLMSGEISPGLFVNAANADFRPAAGSAAIDRCHTQPYSLMDYEERAIIGTCRDFGAFEFDPSGGASQNLKGKPAENRPPAAPKGLRTAEVGAKD
ncbi:MAG TPA: hypothetical protein PLP42_03215 [Acidobacteriota bacterium]|nr:hypothetical protein [Acidobacteriota bacterium]